MYTFWFFKIFKKWSWIILVIALYLDFWQILLLMGLKSWSQSFDATKCVWQTYSCFFNRHSIGRAIVSYHRISFSTYWTPFFDTICQLWASLRWHFFLRIFKIGFLSLTISKSKWTWKWVISDMSSSFLWGKIRFSSGIWFRDVVGYFI